MAGYWSNETGKPLSSFNWLSAHHRAKLPERTTFAQVLSQLKPDSIVDLGCGAGLWLSLLDKCMPSTCDFIGIDVDECALEIAQEQASSWQRNTTFLKLDFEREPETRVPQFVGIFGVLVEYYA